MERQASTTNTDDESTDFESSASESDTSGQGCPSRVERSRVVTAMTAIFRSQIQMYGDDLAKLSNDQRSEVMEKTMRCFRRALAEVQMDSQLQTVVLNQLMQGSSEGVFNQLEVAVTTAGASATGAPAESAPAAGSPAAESDN